MGILDDAIREHLELKRKHGAENADLERIEKEAFGPPSRPGEEEGEAADAASERAEAETTVAPLPGDEPEELREPGEPSGEGRRIDWFEEFDSEEQPLPEDREREESSTAGEEEQPAEAISPAERAPEDETGEQVAPEGVAEPPEAAIFDQGEEVDFDLDLELEEEEGTGSGPAAPPAEPGPPAPEPAPSAAEQGFESPEEDLDLDLDLDLDEEAEGGDGGSPSEELDLTLGEDTPDRAAEGTGETASTVSDAEEGGEEPEGEDLLEETPEFLEDTPEGERLWFEQNPPQEFDFEDEDEDD